MDSTRFAFENAIPDFTSKESSDTTERGRLNPPHSDNAAKEVGEKPRRPFSILRLLNTILGLLFSAVCIVFFLSGAISGIDKYLIENGKGIMLTEVTGGITRLSVQDQSEETSDSGAETNETPAEAEEETYPIVDHDLSAGADSLFILNDQTSLSPNTDDLIKNGNQNKTPAALYAEYGNDAPVVLIYHTHATEGYSSEDTYTKEMSFRSEDTAENVVAIGTVMEKVFTAAGINTLHCTELFDAESYKDSYSRAFSTVSDYLEAYPSITYVFDVHRDAIIKDDLTKVRPVFNYNGMRVAQAMIVVGTNEGGADHDNWEANLALALDIQDNLFSLSESLPRKINLRSAAFNQGLSNGALLLEIGSCGNTLTEAKRCAVLCALALSDSILKESCKLSPDELISELAQ